MPKKIQNNGWFKYIFVVWIFALCVGIDSYLSDLLIGMVKHGNNLYNQVFALHFVKNTGAAFSILQNSTVFLSVLSTVALIAVFWFIFKNISSISYGGLTWLSILASGICGNLLERIYFGFVRDYIELTFCEFPVFNISDMFINLSVFAIIIMLLSRKAKNFKF